MTEREAVVQRLLRRHPDIAPGVVLAAVALAGRRLRRRAQPRQTDLAQAEWMAEEILLLRQVWRDRPDADLAAD